MWADEVLAGEAEKGKMLAGEVEMGDFLTEEFPNFHRHQTSRFGIFSNFRGRKIRS